jgi:hypothetical protein
MAFSREYLKDYESKIRELPVEELYDILSQIRDHAFQADDSPERIRIVEKRIIELTGDKNAILPMPQYSRKLNEKIFSRMTIGSFLFKIGAFVLFLVGIGFVDHTTNQYTSFNFIICGLGFLAYVLGCQIDGQISMHLRELTIARTKEDNPREFKIITTILDLIGFGLIIYGLWAF